MMKISQTIIKNQRMKTVTYKKCKEMKCQMHAFSLNGE